MKFLTPAALVALALTGCGVDDASNTHALSADQAAPPGAGGLELEISGGIGPGLTTTWTVTGAQPGERVGIFRGNTQSAGASCPGLLNGLCFDIGNEQLFRLVTADATGTATTSITLPPTASLPDGVFQYFQAVTRGATAATSDVEALYELRDSLPGTPPPNGTSFHFEWFEIAEVDSTAGTYTGFREENYPSDYFQTVVGNDFSICTIEADANGVTAAAAGACASCDWAFDITYDNYIETTFGGDCLGYIGLDVRNLAAFNLSLGFDLDYNFNGTPTPTLLVYDNTNLAWVPALYGIYYNNATGGLPIYGWLADFSDIGAYYYY